MPFEVGEPIEHGDRCSLDGLVELLQREAHALHDCFTAIGDSTLLKLPLTDSDFESLHVKRTSKHEVKEPAAIYAIRYLHSHQNDEAPRERGFF